MLRQVADHEGLCLGEQPTHPPLDALAAAPGLCAGQLLRTVHVRIPACIVSDGVVRPKGARLSRWCVIMPQDLVDIGMPLVHVRSCMWLALLMGCILIVAM
jgi:hypothetical protein